MKSRLRELPVAIVRWARELLPTVKRHPALAILTVVVALPCAGLFAIQVRSLLGPIYGVHEWRQAWTYSVAHSFVHESASFFYPKHAWRGHLTGIVGMEAPIYPYVLSLLMRVFGDGPPVGRILNFVLFAVGFGFQAKRLGQQTGYPTTLAYVLMTAFSPVVLCEFRQIQPDPAMTSLSVMAAVALHDHGRTGTRKSFALGLGLYTLALLTKPIAIAIMPAMFLFAVMGAKRPPLRGMFLRLLAFAIPLGLILAWDRWAHFLVVQYMDGVPLISIEHNPKQMWAEMQDVGTRRLILMGLVPVYVTHVTLFPAVLFGVPYAMRQETRSWAVPFLAWLVGTVVISLAFSSRYPHNWYYMLLFAPPILFFGAMGVGRVFDVIGMQPRDMLRQGVAFAVILAALLVVPMLADVPWDHIEHVAEQLAVHVRHGVSRGDIYWVAIVAALLGSLSLLTFATTLRRIPDVVLAVLLAGLGAWSLEKPYKDVRQTVRFYSGEVDWEAGYVDSKEIRRAVNRYSTRRDLFVMNGSNPSFLVRALRYGYADDPGSIDRMTRAFYVSKGVRFFMQFPESGPFPATMQGAPLLERGARWELYCIDPKGCPPRKR